MHYPLSPVLAGDGDVHWGYDLAFDPWPCEAWTRSPASSSHGNSKIQKNNGTRGHAASGDGNAIPLSLAAGCPVCPHASGTDSDCTRERERKGILEGKLENSLQKERLPLEAKRGLGK